MTPRALRLPRQRAWLRVAHPDWVDPLDPSWAHAAGGRWNAPGAFATLYLNADVLTARLQIVRMCAGTPLTPEDLNDDAYLLHSVQLPDRQRAADAVRDEGLVAMRLPTTYPLDLNGIQIPHAPCQSIGLIVHRLGLDGVWCRSAATPDGRGRELAWFPGRRRARAIGGTPLSYGRWRHAESWIDIGLPAQIGPA